MRKTLLGWQWLTVSTMLAAVACGQGDQGPAGPRGLAGGAGAGGAQGAKGAAGATGAAGTGGSTGGDGVATTALIVTPSSITTERDVSVTVTILGGKLNGTATLDMGPGITVKDVTVQQGDTLRARVRAAGAAPLGPRTVKVTSPLGDSGTNVSAYTGVGAAEVRSPLRVRVAAGEPQQGGLVAVDVFNEDSVAFDPSTLSLLVGASNPYVDATFLGLLSSGPAAARALIMLDVKAPTTAQVVLGNFSLGGDDPDTSFFSAPDAIKIAARTPTALVSGTPVTGETPATEFGTKLYSIASTGPSVVTVNVTGTGTAATPAFWLLSGTGKGNEILAYQGIGARTNTALSSLTFGAGAGEGPFYLVVSDNKGRTGDAAEIGWSVAATSTAGTVVAEMAGDHETGATAQAVPTGNGPFVVTGSNVNYETDVYKVTFAAAGVPVVSLSSKNFFTSQPLAAVEISDTPDFTNVTGEVPMNGDRVGSVEGVSGTVHYIRVVGGDWTTPYVLSVAKK